jgi:hypothetical protein
MGAKSINIAIFRDKSAYQVYCVYCVLPELHPPPAGKSTLIVMRLDGPATPHSYTPAIHILILDFLDQVLVSMGHGL